MTKFIFILTLFSATFLWAGQNEPHALAGEFECLVANAPRTYEVDVKGRFTTLLKTQIEGEDPAGISAPTPFVEKAAGSWTTLGTFTRQVSYWADSRHTDPGNHYKICLVPMWLTFAKGKDGKWTLAQETPDGTYSDCSYMRFRTVTFPCTKK